MTDYQQDLERFYELMAELREKCGGERRLEDCHGRLDWPRAGVYFFFEDGEARIDGSPRVVRVGTHALNAGSKTTLWNRLSQHRGGLAGGGNHRGSIFRLHVGAALAARNPEFSGMAATWGVKSLRDRATKDGERKLEAAVSGYIGRMPFLWLEVDDEPGKQSERGVIEAGSIALLSARLNPVADTPSPGWLGHDAARETIRTSGLWNVRHVDDDYDPAFLDVLDRRVRQVA